MPKGINKINLVQIAGLLLACVHLPANAFTIDSSTRVGDTFGVTWELLGGATDSAGSVNNTGSGMTGGATFEYLGQNDTQIGFELTLTNTTATTANAADTSLNGFGFGTDPNLSVAAWNGDTGSAGSGGVAGGTGSGGGGGGTGGTGSGGSVAGIDGSGAPTGDSTDRFVATPGTAGGLPPGAASEPFVFALEIPDVIDLTAQPITVSPLEAIYAVNGPDGGAESSLQVAIPVPGTLLLVGAGLLMARRRLLKSA